MDPATLIKLIGPAILATIGVALAVLLTSAFLPRRGLWKKLHPAAMPVALATAFVAGYAVMFSFPQGTLEHAWYLDQPWKMAVVAAVASGAVLAVGHLVPLVEILVILALITFCVRGPWLAPKELIWEDWKSVSGFLAASLTAYALAMIPVRRHPHLWLVGPLVVWASLTAGAVVVMAWVDQGLGKMLILLAVLAGVTAVAGIFTLWRALAGTGAHFLAIMFGAVLALALRYNDVLPPAVLYLLASGPLGAAMAWLPGLRRRPWICLVLAMAVTGGLLAVAVGVAVTHAPALE